MEGGIVGCRGVAKRRLGGGGRGARVSRMDEAKFSMGSVKRVSQFMSGHM